MDTWAETEEAAMGWKGALAAAAAVAFFRKSRRRTGRSLDIAFLLP